MLSAEERRQRILAGSEKRLAKLRDANRSEMPSDIPPMLPVSVPAPPDLLKKSEEVTSSSPIISQTNNNQQSSSSWSSLFSTITSATSMMNIFSSLLKPKTAPENTKEMILLDKQHILVFILGIFVGLLYSFYISSQSNFFFLIYFTCSTCILTSRYYMMQMKHRTNILITTAMLSGFKPELMKYASLVYTLICDAWVIFAFYFVSFCLTHVICSLFKN
ncbi:unnamed protein product [Adineta steineri]|uniref:Uncharacterized protein n=1 Tax=Adineta steineri TaxID=433720 RepID=A0A816CIB8_9BILA|nr:unnamed protein product [Adineta steineri]CAF1286500.1 unnamed protein product [Adineta steineri]CAF1427668.1 unnamed protein product [Adineta steineri]CAF1623097.1 unnamed protein product [Adineta steineri]